MPRDDGFAVADTATSKLDDPKFRKLWRRVQDEAAMNAAVVLHDAVQLASWASGGRVTAEDAAPVWIADVAGATSNLQAVGLLDKDGKIPAHAWESWYGAARDRRQKRRDAGQLGGRPPKQSETDAEPLPNQTVSDAKPSLTSRITTDNPDPSVPSVRTEPTVPSEPHTPSIARESGPEKIGAILPDLDLKPDAIPLDVRRLQKLAEELTQQPYVMANIHGGWGAKAIAEQLPHGFDRVEKAWRQIASRAPAEGASRPTLRQLVLGADDILNPVPQADTKAQRSDEAQRDFDRRVKRTQEYIASLRPEEDKSA